MYQLGKTDHFLIEIYLDLFSFILLNIYLVIVFNILTYISSPFPFLSPTLPHIPLAVKFMGSFFLNNTLKIYYIYTFIPKYNSLSPYCYLFVYDFRADHFYYISNSGLLFREDHFSHAQHFPVAHRL